VAGWVFHPLDSCTFDKAHIITQSVTMGVLSERVFRSIPDTRAFCRAHVAAMPRAYWATPVPEFKELYTTASARPAAAITSRLQIPDSGGTVAASNSLIISAS
jgi:hypothetical protein